MSTDGADRASIVGHTTITIRWKERHVFLLKAVQDLFDLALDGSKKETNEDK